MCFVVVVLLAAQMPKQWSVPPFWMSKLRHRGVLTQFSHFCTLVHLHTRTLMCSWLNPHFTQGRRLRTELRDWAYDGVVLVRLVRTCCGTLNKCTDLSKNVSCFPHRYGSPVDFIKPIKYVIKKQIHKAATVKNTIQGFVAVRQQSFRILLLPLQLLSRSKIMNIVTILK